MPDPKEHLINRVRIKSLPLTTIVGLLEVDTFGVTEVTVTGFTNMKLRNVLSKSTPLVDTSTGTMEPVEKAEVVKTSVCGEANEATKIWF